MKNIIPLSFAILLAGCGDFKAIDAEVEILGLQPSAFPAEPSNAVLYRVLSPSEQAGKYGVDYTALTAAEVENRKGEIYRIKRLGKWQLSSDRPVASSVSKGEDFFSTAVPK